MTGPRVVTTTLCNGFILNVAGSQMREYNCNPFYVIGRETYRIRNSYPISPTPFFLCKLYCSKYGSCISLDWGCGIFSIIHFLFFRFSQ
jgi:hypothetical protein